MDTNKAILMFEGLLDAVVQKGGILNVKGVKDMFEAIELLKYENLKKQKLQKKEDVTQ